MKRTRAETLNLESIFTTGVNLHSQGGGRHPSLTKQLTYFYENFKNCKKKKPKVSSIFKGISERVLLYIN